MKIKGTKVESTPCTLVEVTYRGEVIAVCSLYWSVNAGTYGYQIAACGWTLDDSGELQQWEHKTGGCGYCKETAAFEVFCQLLGVDWRAGSPPARALKGNGNYRKVALGTLRRLAEGVRRGV